MAEQPKRRFWHTCRVYFRRFRIAVWLFILALVGAAVYLNQVGLPDIVKQPLLERLRARGLDLQFSRLRLSWYRGIVAENVRFGSAQDPASPSLTVEEVQLQFNHQALRRFQAQVDALELRGGRLIWPISESNQPPRQLVLDNIQTHLAFLPDDEWALDNFRAVFAGAKIQLSGTVTHASAVQDWPYLRKRAEAHREVSPSRLQKVGELLERVQFHGIPEIRLDLRGDGRDPRSFLIRLLVNAPDAETPWGSFSQGRFTARLLPSRSNEVSRALIGLDAAYAQTRWGSTTNLQLNLQLGLREGEATPVSAEANLGAASASTPWADVGRLRLRLHLSAVEGGANLVRGSLQLQAARADSQWATATQLQGSAQWTHSLTNPVPLSGEGRIESAQAATRWGSARGLRIAARLETASPSPRPRPDPSWAGWGVLDPYLLDWTAHAEEVAVSNLVAHGLIGNGTWAAPDLVVSNLQAQIGQRPLNVQAALNVATRQLRAKAVSLLDPHDLEMLLGENTRRELAAFSWSSPPTLWAETALVLPAWTNRHPDWRAEVEPSLRLAGEFKFDQGAAYRGLSLSSVQSHFSFSNQCWHLPDLLILRPEGRLAVEHRTDTRTKEFQWRLASTLDPTCVSPLLKTNDRAIFDLIKLSQPPVVEAQLRGRWDQLETTTMEGQVALTNLSFRGEQISGVQTRLAYSNQIV
jgi:hypothetical protein